MTDSETYPPAPERLEFSGFRLIPDKRLLLNSEDEKVALTARAYDILQFLVEHRGKVMSKHEIMDAVWPGTVVEENNLNQAVHAIRRALGDEGPDHQFIVNVPRRGYSFVDNVRSMAARDDDIAESEGRELAKILRNRMVVKVAAIYAVAAWFLIMLTEYLLVAVEAPAWVLPTIVVVFILIVPLALILYWIYGFIASGNRGPERSQTTATTSGFGAELTAVLLIFSVAGVTTFERLTEVSLLSVFSPPQQITEAPEVRRTSINLGPSEYHPYRGVNSSFAIAPDGSRVAFFRYEDWEWHLYVRELDELEPRSLNVSVVQGVEIPGPIFSPDGQSIAYYGRGGNLHRISIAGGSQPDVITNQALVAGVYGMSWIEDDIYFVGRDWRIYRVPASGGTPTRLNIPDSDQLIFTIHPEVLPGNKAILMTAARRGAQAGEVLLFDLETETSTKLLSGGSARYVPSGHILYMRADNTMQIVPFDVEELRVTGEDVALPFDIESLTEYGFVNYSFSDEGQLLYQPPENATPQQRAAESNRSVPMWVDRDGTEHLLDLPARMYVQPDLSPDYDRVVFRIDSYVEQNAVAEGLGTDIWIYDFVRETMQRLTFGQAAIQPVWLPDGERIVYADVFDGFSIWLTNADGSGEPGVLFRSERNSHPWAIAQEGNTLIYSLQMNGVTKLFQMPLFNPEESEPLIESDYVHRQASLSPDGQFMAYRSMESGQGEIYVRPYPNVEDGKWQISEGGWATDPEWRGDGQELFYRQFDAETGVTTVFSVPVDTSAEFVPGRPQALFSGNYMHSTQGTSFDVNEAGDQFLLLKPMPNLTIAPASDMVSLVLVENWFDELEQLAPVNQ